MRVYPIWLQSGTSYYDTVWYTRYIIPYLCQPVARYSSLAPACASLNVGAASTPSGADHEQVGTRFAHDVPCDAIGTEKSKVMHARRKLRLLFGWPQDVGCARLPWPVSLQRDRNSLRWHHGAALQLHMPLSRE